MSPGVLQSPPPAPTPTPLWTWTNAACGLFEFGALEDFRAALATGRLTAETLIWRNSPGCQSIPARFVSVPWTLHRPGAAPEKVDFATLQHRYFTGLLPPTSKLGQDGAISPEQIFGPRPAR
jgi:hypothetical protein